jgi:hypothetical protein
MYACHQFKTAISLDNTNPELLFPRGMENIMTGPTMWCQISKDVANSYSLRVELREYLIKRRQHINDLKM